ncbi:MULTISPECIES: hypothetical protein [Bacillales]|uniref:hypothetical protein n=1 Tax=Bacillales TaxID=1385 RepID=UPI001E2EB39B|nr:hypothetical protein [Metabacillus sp. B2-18]UGB30960.1 hypothetical protein LPC09_25295 [Metabacillus sp. B2-18]
MEEDKDLLLDLYKDMEKLELIIFDRSAEILFYRAFIKEKGLEEEFEQRVKEATALTKINRFI